MPKTTQRIKIESNINWDEANVINPSFQQQGTNLSWDDYNLAKKKADDFDRLKWFSGKEIHEAIIRASLDNYDEDRLSVINNFVKRLKEELNKGG